MNKNDLEKQEKLCMKIPLIKEKIDYEKKLSNFVNFKMKEYKNDEIKLNKLRVVYDNYLKMNVGKEEQTVDKSYFNMKYEGKRREIKDLFKKLEDTYSSKIEELIKNKTKGINSMDDKIFKIGSQVKDKFYHESTQVNELREEIKNKEKLLKDKKDEYENMDYFIYNIQNKINSNLNLHKECKFDYNIKNCPSDNYNYFILMLLLNIVTIVGYHFLF